MIVEFDEMKQYLRVDFTDDDDFIESALHSSEVLCADIARVEVSELSSIPVAKIGIMYAVAYLYEHREEADYHALEMTLRSLFSGVRGSRF